MHLSNIMGYIDDHALHLSVTGLPSDNISVDSAIMSMEMCLCDIDLWMSKLCLKRMRQRHRQCLLYQLEENVGKVININNVKIECSSLDFLKYVK